jgi:hypothetical protein
MKHWVVAPYHFDAPEEWQRVWAFNESEGCISLGWPMMGDVSSLTLAEIKKRFALKLPGSKPGRINSDSSMLFKFYNGIEIGHTVVARAGRKSLAAIGKVTRAAYFDAAKGRGVYPRGNVYPNHIDVEWRQEPRGLIFPKQEFGLMAVHSITHEKLTRLIDSPAPRTGTAEELPNPETYPEGAKSTIVVNSYERSAKARAECLRHHGYACHVCQMSFAERYGELGLNFIHVHHLDPIAAKKKRYRIRPTKDLVPVCPNCHAMMHRCNPPLNVKQLRKIIRDNQ